MFRSLLLSCSLLGFLANGALMAMEEEDKTTVKVQSKRKNPSQTLSPFDFEKTFPEEMQDLIVQHVVFEQCLEDTSPVNITLVCKKWKDIVSREMQVGKPGWKAWYGIVGLEKETIYQQFLNGKLIYKPDPQSDEGMITLPILALKNPLEGTFDLSGCGDTEQYLSISIGYRKVQNPANADKVEVWFTPRFLVDKKMPQLAGNHHMRMVTKTWDAEKAPIGIFWTWGEWNASSHMAYCDYLTTESMAELGSENLLKKYQKAVDYGWWARPAGLGGGGGAQKFHISFVN